MSYYLGIDIGTTGCKVVAFNYEGEQICSASAEYPLIFPRSGWIELDPELVWRNIVRYIREVAAKTRRDPVSALRYLLRVKPSFQSMQAEVHFIPAL